METPLRGRSGGHIGTAPYAFCLRELRVDVRPYGFVWVDCAQAVGVLSSKNSYEVYGKKFCTH